MTARALVDIDGCDRLYIGDRDWPVNGSALGEAAGKAVRKIGDFGVRSR